MIPNPSSLKKLKKTRLYTEQVMFDCVLRKCIDSITTANANTSKTHIVFPLPLFLISYPNYNVNDCARWMSEKLTSNGYHTCFTRPNFLRIDWGVKRDSKKNSDYIKRFIEANPGAEIEFEYQG
jgi:hypothetical protein